MACAAFLIFLLLMSRTIEYSVRIMTENFIILQVKFWGTSTTDIPALFLTKQLYIWEVLQRQDFQQRTMTTGKLLPQDIITPYKGIVLNK